jgi:hypothetical protein
MNADTATACYVIRVLTARGRDFLPLARNEKLEAAGSSGEPRRTAIR